MLDAILSFAARGDLRRELDALGGLGVHTDSEVRLCDGLGLGEGVKFEHEVLGVGVVEGILVELM